MNGDVLVLVNNEPVISHVNAHLSKNLVIHYLYLHKLMSEPDSRRNVISDLKHVNVFQ